MRRSAVPRRHVKFLDEEYCHGEEHLQQVVTKTERVVAAGGGGGGDGDGGPYFLSKETTGTVDAAVPAAGGRDRPRFPNLQAMFTHRPMHMQEELPEARAATTEEKKAAAVQEITTTSKMASFERGIDVEAEEFIRRKRHSLEQQRLMSMKAA